MYTSLSWFLLLQSFLSKLLFRYNGPCVFPDRGNLGPCVEIVLFVLFVHVLVHHPGVLHLQPQKKKETLVAKHCTRCFQVFPEMILYRICRCTYTHVFTYYIDSLLSSQQNNNLITQSPPPTESPGKLAEPSLESVGEHCCTGNLHFADAHWSKCH